MASFGWSPPETLVERGTPLVTEAGGATSPRSTSACPRCKGYGSERDMASGRSIVCRECSGAGFTDPDPDDADPEEDE